MKLTCYNGWSINIECQRCVPDSQPPTFTAMAVVARIGQSTTTATDSKRFVVSLPGVEFPTSQAANAAIEHEAKRQLDALVVEQSTASSRSA